MPFCLHISMPFCLYLHFSYDSLRDFVLSEVLWQGDFARLRRRLSAFGKRAWIHASKRAWIKNCSLLMSVKTCDRKCYINFPNKFTHYFLSKCFPIPSQDPRLILSPTYPFHFLFICQAGKKLLWPYWKFSYIFLEKYLKCVCLKLFLFYYLLCFGLN